MDAKIQPALNSGDSYRPLLPLPLQGHIEHADGLHLRLPPSLPHSAHSHKRERTETKKNVRFSFPDNDIKDKNYHEQNQNVALVGFYFTTTLSTDTSRSTHNLLLGERSPSNKRSMPPSSDQQQNAKGGVLYYSHQLVLPQTMLLIACDAIRFQLQVTITDYTISKDTPYVLVVQHLHLTQDSQKQSKISLPSSILTLSQFQEIEQSSKHKKRLRQERYSITGIVDAISPIIIASPTMNTKSTSPKSSSSSKSDPFALIELYQNNTNEQENVFTATIVLKGKAALTCQPAIQPGQQLTFSRVKRQRWHVPQKPAFQCKESALCGESRLYNRAPSHVFVVADPTSIIWDEDKLPSKSSQPLTNDTRISVNNDHKYSQRLECEFIPPPLPSTVYPLKSIQGKILSVQYSSSSSRNRSLKVSSIQLPSSRIIRSVIIDTKQKASKIYLAYYCMAPEVYLGLRKGAYLRAVNVHIISLFPNKCDDDLLGVCDYTAYGACLRSTISLLACSSTTQSDTLSDDDKKWNHVHNYSILQNIRYTYSEMEWISRVKRGWYDICFEQDHKDQISPSPSLSTLELTLSLVLQCLFQDRNQDQKRKVGRRDPYEEFYDHGCDCGDDDDTIDTPQSFENASGESEVIPEDKIYQPVFNGCTVVKIQSKSSSKLPVVKSLNFIKKSCIQKLQKSLLEFIHPNNHHSKDNSSQKNEIEVGWIGSIHLDQNHLSKTMGLNNDNKVQSIPILTGGMVKQIDTTALKIFQLQDKECQLTCCPLVTSPKEMTSTSGSFCRVGEFAIVRVKTAIVSCMFLGKFKDFPDNEKNVTSLRESSDKVVSSDLPSAIDSQGLQINGPSAILRIMNHVFIVSVQILYNVEDVYTKSSSDNENTYERESLERHFVSIENCLTSNFRGDKRRIENRDYVLGCLVRQRWKVRKEQGYKYGGCTVTLSHLPLKISDGWKNDYYSHQCIDLKLSMPTRNTTPDSTHIIQQALHDVGSSISINERSSAVLHHEVITMACAWLLLSQNAETSPILSCGWDEDVHLPRASSNTTPEETNFLMTNKHTQVCISFPASTQNVNKYGYMNFSCNSDSIHAYFIARNEKDNGSDGEKFDSVSESDFLNTFSFIGGKKFLPGTMDTTFARRALCFDNNGKGRLYGEILPREKELLGVPMTCLSQMYNEICHNVSQNVCHLSNPSLVVNIKRAQILQITFCRARAECSQCFQSLINTDKQVNGYTHVKNASNTRNFGDSSVPKNSQPSYWHLPLPTDKDAPVISPPVQKSKKEVPVKKATEGKTARLYCPSGCNGSQSAIKWECSAIIEDGTGTAKIYAERDAVLMLMGSGLDVQTVELAAWQSDQGIVYQRSVPPSSQLKYAVYETQYKVGNQRQLSSSSDSLKRLPLTLRGEYTLQKFCRQSTEPLRTMDFLVRCKPVLREKLVNHTDINITSMKGTGGDAIDLVGSTFRFPKLEVSLVDCTRCQDELNEEGWDIVRDLKST